MVIKAWDKCDPVSAENTFSAGTLLLHGFSSDAGCYLSRTEPWHFSKPISKDPKSKFGEGKVELLVAKHDHCHLSLKHQPGNSFYWADS